MSKSVPPEIQGQVNAPNPLELFWEKNRRVLQGLMVLLAAGLAGFYVWQYMQRQQANERAEEFTKALYLDGQFDKNVTVVSGSQFTEIEKLLAKADGPTIEKRLGDFSSKQRPWLLWVAANRYYQAEQLDKALAMLDRLENEFGEHYLCVQTSYPTQMRLTKQKDDEDEDEQPQPGDEPDLEPAVKGSLSGRLREAIQADTKFKNTHSGFFAAKQPDGDKVTFHFDRGAVVVQLYKGAAPEQVKHLKKLVQEKFYNDQKIHWLQRNPVADPDGNEPQTVHIGLSASKGDISQVAAAMEAASDKALDFPQNDVQRGLSFFPGVLALEPEADGKTSGERLFFALNECAATFDGRRAILGRIISGLDLLKEINGSTLNTQEQDDLGIGQPSEDIMLKFIEWPGVSDKAASQPKKGDDKSPVKKGAPQKGTPQKDGNDKKDGK